MKVDGHKVTQEDVSKHVRGGNQLSTKVKLTVERHGSGNIEEVVCMCAPSVFVEHTKVSESRKCPVSSAGQCFVGGGFFGPPQIWRAHARGSACVGQMESLSSTNVKMKICTGAANHMCT